MQRFALSLAMVAALQLDAPRAHAKPTCPTDTYFDGMACAHARETCGGWDGTSCGAAPRPDFQEQRARDEYARIDLDARAVCTEDDTSAYQGSVGQVKTAVDEALEAAKGIDERLQWLRVAVPTPRWRTATLARAGTLYDCIRERLLRASPALFTPKQQQQLQRLQTIANQVPGGTIQLQIAALTADARIAWLETSDRYLQLLTEKIVVHYVTAAVLARRYALEGFALTPAARRLPIVAAALGDHKMATIVAGIPDPTDQREGLRTPRPLHYVPGAFGSFQ